MMPSSRSASRAAARVCSVSVEQADNGGFIVHDQYDNAAAGESYAPPAVLSFDTIEDVALHLREVFSASAPGRRAT